MTELTLPLGPSANRMYKTFRGITVPSKEYTIFKREVKRIGREAQCVPHGGPICVNISYHPKARLKETNKPLRRLDTDGPIKPVLDALQGIAYENDYQVECVTCQLSPPVPGGALIVQWKTA